MTGVATLILNGAVATNVKSRDNVTSTPSVVSVSDCDITSGKELTVDIDINGDYGFSGYQFDLVLPEGIRVKTDGNSPCAYLSNERTTFRNTDYFSCRMVETNRLRVLCASTSGSQFEGTSGTVARLTLIADEGIQGDYTVSVENALLSSDGNTRNLDSVSFIAHANNATGINNVDAFKENADIYDVTGKKVNPNTFNGISKGVYIINGKKYVK